MSAGLVLEGIRAGYGPVEVLHGVDLVFPAGMVVALLGHNGSGSSTVLRCAAGLVAPRSGRVLWDGVDITHASGYRRSSAGLCYVADEHAAFATLTVGENLALFGRPAPLEDSIARAVAVFPELGRRLDQRAGTLSGGERQMLALTRVLVRPARALLLDEVSRGLATEVADRFFTELGLLAGPDRVIVVCEPFGDMAVEQADLVYVMRRGAVTFAGQPGELDDDRLTAALH